MFAVGNMDLADDFFFRREASPISIASNGNSAQFTELMGERRRRKGKGEGKEGET